MHDFPKDCIIPTSVEDSLKKNREEERINGNVFSLFGEINKEAIKNKLKGVSPDAEIKKIYNKVVLNPVEKAKLLCFFYKCLKQVKVNLKFKTDKDFVEYLSYFEDIYRFFNQRLSKIEDPLNAYSKSVCEREIERVVEHRERCIDTMFEFFDKDVFSGGGEEDYIEKLKADWF